MAHLKLYGPPLPVAGDEVSINCLVMITLRRADGTQRPDHNPGRHVILEFREPNHMKAIELTEGRILFFDTSGDNGSQGPWERVFTRISRDMDWSDYYDGRRGGGFDEEEEEAR